MSMSQADVEHDERTNTLVAQFPAFHQPSDCIKTVRRIGGIFGRILKPHCDWRPFEGTIVDPQFRSSAKVYSFRNAIEVAAKLRAVLGIEETKSTLSTLEMVRRLAPEIFAIHKLGITLGEIAEALTTFGVDVTEAELASCFPSLSDI
jgi:hypothetical protein